MALPRKYQHDTEIPEGLREHAVQGSDGTWTIEFEGEGGGSEDLAKLQRAIQHEREQRRKATEELRQLSERFKDVDPEKAREALAQLDQLEEERLREKKDFETLASRRFEPKIKQLEQQIAQMQQALEQEKQRVAAQRSKYESVAIDQNLESTFIRVGADPKKIPLVLPKVREPWKMDENDRAVAMDGENLIYGVDPSRPISMEEYARTFLRENPWLALESHGASTTQRQLPGTVNGNTVQIPEQVARTDHVAYKRLKALAEREGKTLEIVPSAS